MEKQTNIVIVGGGNAGFLSALEYVRAGFNVTLLSSGDTIRVGESTSFVLPLMLRRLNINENEWMRECNAVLKFSINFKDWGEIGSRYYHPFAYPGEYGYHYDVDRFTSFLQKVCAARGVRIINDLVTDIVSNETGIKYVETASGEKVDGDYFIDCTGFKSLLIGKHHNQQFKSHHKNIILNDRAVALQCNDAVKEVNYTESTALSNGWMWTISLQNRTDYGYVYSSDYISDSDAEKELRTKLNNFTSPARVVHFKVGMYEKAAIKNCIGVGLSTSFVEPLQSTGYTFICRAILSSIDYINKKITEDEFNYIMKDTYIHNKAFIEMHYYMCSRNDTAYWNYYKRFKPTPERLQQIVDTYSTSLNTPHGRAHWDYTIKGLQGIINSSLIPPWFQ